MNPKSLLVLLTGILFFTSCSKEESFEKRKAETNDKVPLLVKVTMQPVGTLYTMVTALTYDNKKRLINIKNELEGSVGSPYGEEETIYYRNPKGLIERMVVITNHYGESGDFQGKDSAVLQLQVNANGQYRDGLRTILFSSNDQLTDSIAYSYNEKGRIGMVKIFRKETNGDTYSDEQATSYTYDANGNITMMTIKFEVNGQDPPQVIRFQYNEKLSPINFGDEALLNGFIMEGFNSPHCLIGISEPADPDSSWEMTYEYNELNKPVKGVYSNAATQDRMNFSYFYQ